MDTLETTNTPPIFGQLDAMEAVELPDAIATLLTKAIDEILDLIPDWKDVKFINDDAYWIGLTPSRIVRITPYSNWPASESVTRVSILRPRDTTDSDNYTKVIRLCGITTSDLIEVKEISIRD